MRGFQPACEGVTRAIRPPANVGITNYIPLVSSLAAYPGMMQRGRRREGLRVCRAAWLLGVTVREYRELEAGERLPDASTWERMCEAFGWPTSHWPPS